jgi:hypothetical protein
MAEISNPPSLTPEQDLMNRLDNHFLFLLHFYDNPTKNLPDDKRAIAKQWIEKLSTMHDSQTITAKTRRNEYLTKLLNCIQSGILCEPFNQSPPNNDQLPFVDFGFSRIVEEIPNWVNELKRREEREVKVGGKSFETYLSSKLLDNGACAYLAVTAQNEGSRTAWTKIMPNRVKVDRIKKTFAKEFAGVDAAFEKFEDEQ